MYEYLYIIITERYIHIMKSISIIQFAQFLLYYSHTLYDTVLPGYNITMRPVKPWDLLNKDNWTMEEVRAKRLEICSECENFNALRQCKLCHCFMDAKTMLENAYCPLRKW